MGSTTSGRQGPTQAVDVSRVCPPHLHVSDYVHVVRKNWSEQDEIEMGLVALVELQREWCIGGTELQGVLGVAGIKPRKFKGRYVVDEDTAVEAIKELRIQDDEFDRGELGRMCLASEGAISKALKEGYIKPKRMLGKVMVFGNDQAHALNEMLREENRTRSERKKKQAEAREAMKIGKDKFIKTVGAKKSALAKEYHRRYGRATGYAENWWGE